MLISWMKSPWKVKIHIFLSLYQKCGGETRNLRRVRWWYSKNNWKSWNCSGCPGVFVWLNGNFWGVRQMVWNLNFIAFSAYFGNGRCLSYQFSWFKYLWWAVFIFHRSLPTTNSVCIFSYNNPWPHRLSIHIQRADWSPLLTTRAWCCLGWCLGMSQASASVQDEFKTYITRDWPACK